MDDYEANLQALEAIYPNMAKLLRKHTGPVKSLSSDQKLLELAETIIDEYWDSHVYLTIIYRFAASPLPFMIYERMMNDELFFPRNRRFIFIEDRPEQANHAFYRRDWRRLINSDRCLFVIDYPENQSFKRLLERYPDIALVEAKMYCCDPTDDSYYIEFANWFYELQNVLWEKFNELAAPRPLPPLPKAIRFLMPGHNIFQDACVQALTDMGYDAQRLQWKDPLHRFVRETAWSREYAQGNMDTAVLVNITPRLFSLQTGLAERPLRRAVWFVDNPLRFAHQPGDFEGCDAIGVFDPVYIPYLRHLTDAPVFELRTGHGLQAPVHTESESFQDVDVAFVGELGAKGTQALEQSFLILEPEIPQGVDQFLQAHDVMQNTFITPLAQEFFERNELLYHGSAVELLENKATGLRRRYFLEAVSDFGLKIFGDEDWNAPEFAGKLTENWAGRRLDYTGELPPLYASAKINLNIFHVQCFSAPNPRVYDVLACGGFLITSYNEGLKDEFVLGEELVVFHTREELVDLVRYYLDHEDERREITQRGQAKVLAKCAYHDRMQTLLHALESRRCLPENQVFCPNNTIGSGDKHVYFCE